LRKVQTPWNTVNIMSAGFLVVLIVFIMVFFMYQKAQEQLTDYPLAPNQQGDSLKEQVTSLEAGLKELADRESELKIREEKLAEQEAFLSEQEASLKDLVDVRTNIIKELVDSFSQSNMVLDIDSQTGAIRFSDGIFFDSNDDTIKANGAEYLRQFIPAYFSILLSEANRDYVAEIIIEGHTDDTGAYIYNLDLSQRRAFAVARFILESDIPNFEYQDIIHNYLTANGRSYSQPIMTGGIIDKVKSRRVEFKFRLKDEETIKEMQHIFEGIDS
jgi:chemotaxis protein MotB